MLTIQDRDNDAEKATDFRHTREFTSCTANDIEVIADFCRRHHIRKLSLFGSGLRDDFRPESDAAREAVALTAEKSRANPDDTVDLDVVWKTVNLGVGKSMLNADFELKNPLAFDLRFVEAAHELTVDGKPLAKGRREKFLLHAGRPNRLLLPVELSNGSVLSGLWKAATGGRVEGVLTGIAKLRVPAGSWSSPSSSR